MDTELTTNSTMVAWMREASPYIQAHRGQVFVVYASGEALEGPYAAGLMQDLVLLCGLGVKLVVVHGARVQIDRALQSADAQPVFVNDQRQTQANELPLIKRAVAEVRTDIEASLSQAVADGLGRAAHVTVAGGNYITARPSGVVAGVDLAFTGEVRRVDRNAIERRLEDDELVLISPLAYSPTGEIFNLNALDLATAVACELSAAKLILLTGFSAVQDATGNAIRQLTVRESRELSVSDNQTERFLGAAIRACQFGVSRVHLVDRDRDGAVIEELYTRDGVGTLVSNTPFDQMRLATIDDVGGILALIEPMEEDGVLVKRSREKLEMEIDRFSVLVREGVVVACGAIYPYGTDSAEFACVAVHPDYRRTGFGQAVLEVLEKRARDSGIRQAFVLTTQATHWFIDSGFAEADIADLPIERQALYNYQRNSKVLAKRM